MIEGNGQQKRIGEVEKELIDEDGDGEMRGNRIKESLLTVFHFHTQNLEYAASDVGVVEGEFEEFWQGKRSS
jgi:hypothetical protein